MEGFIPLDVLLLIQRVSHLFRHVLELRQYTRVELLSIGELIFRDQFFTHISDSFKVGHDTFKGLSVCAHRVTSDLIDLEPQIDVISNFIFLFLRLVDKVLTLMICSSVICFREANVSDITSLHGSHHDLVVFMKAWVFHFKLLIDLPSL